MSAIRLSLTAFTLALSSAGILQAEEPTTAQTESPSAVEIKSEVPASGNQMLFSPAKREVRLPKGGQEIAALGTLAVFLIVGFLLLRTRGTASAMLTMTLATTLFYSAWVYHKWTISGHEVILHGHLISWGVAALGVSLGALSILNLARNRSSTPLSRFWILPLAVFLTLGVVTGTATIFEAGPTIFGIDAPLYQIGLMVVLGSWASAASIVTFTGAICRMAPVTNRSS